jgi:hypothetical protein
VAHGAAMAISALIDRTTLTPLTPFRALDRALNYWER